MFKIRLYADYLKYSEDTVGENIIVAPKMRNNYGVVQSCIFPILQ